MLALSPVQRGCAPFYAATGAQNYQCTSQLGLGDSHTSDRTHTHTHIHTHTHTHTRTHTHTHTRTH
eukprot:COSAG03_NODE_20677_length_315_cov_1.101852_1_plen_65_part_10